MHRAVLLIIRRSWVRAPPAPPASRARPARSAVLGLYVWLVVVTGVRRGELSGLQLPVSSRDGHEPGEQGRADLAGLRVLAQGRVDRQRLPPRAGQRTPGPTRARSRAGRRAGPRQAPKSARRAAAYPYGPDRRPADSPRRRPAAPVPLPAARDEPCRRYPVRAGRPQTYPVILLQSAASMSRGLHVPPRQVSSPVPTTGSWAGSRQ
jgi:hypothetical protein